jgi:uncharacterized protein (TIGR02118 family)
MVKVVTFLKRRPDLSVEAFQEYWRARHPAFVTRLPGVRRYVQSHALPSTYQRGEPAYDGIAEVWANDTDALRAMTRTAEYARVQADEANFIDRAGMGVVVTEDHIVKDGPITADAVKGVEFVRRQAGMDVEAFQQYWREVHGPMAAAIPGLRRYVQSHTRRSAYAAGRTPAWDGLALTWFDSTEALRAAEVGAAYVRALADRARFLAPDPVTVVLTREYVVLD